MLTPNGQLTRNPSTGAYTVQYNIAENRYLYNGKELENYTLGTTYLGTLDYGVRHYDPRIARWTVPDPMAEKDYGISAYAYGGDNPLLLIDKDGQFPEIARDIANVILDLKSLISNISQGKVGASVVDGLGLVVDVAAATLPFVPGGAGTAIKGVRATDKAVDAAKQAHGHLPQKAVRGRYRLRHERQGP